MEYSKEMYKKLSRAFFYGDIKEEHRQNELMEPYDSSYTVFKCLCYLAEYPDGLEPSKLADDLLLLRQTVTSIADKLEKRGLIFRESHPVDRRKILLKLTEKGREMSDQMFATSSNYYGRIMKEFTEEELNEFINLRKRFGAVGDEVLKQILDERGEQ